MKKLKFQVGLRVRYLGALVFRDMSRYSNITIYLCTEEIKILFKQGQSIAVSQQIGSVYCSVSTNFAVAQLVEALSYKEDGKSSIPDSVTESSFFIQFCSLLRSTCISRHETIFKHYNLFMYRGGLRVHFLGIHVFRDMSRYSNITVYLCTEEAYVFVTQEHMYFET